MAELRPLSLKPVVLATGGTGGHVFPAEALAGELEARGLPFALVTDSRGRQWQGALARRPIHYIRSASPSGSLQRRLLALLSLGLGLFDAWRALGRIGPAAVIGFGGYASVPTMIAARLRRLPAMVHEQNAVLGKANRLVLGGVAKVATSFARTRFVGDKAYLVGNPVRDAVRALRASVYRAPGPDRARGPRRSARSSPTRSCRCRSRRARGCASCSNAGRRISSGCAAATCRPTSSPSWRRSSPTCRNAWPRRIW